MHNKNGWMAAIAFALLLIAVVSVSAEPWYKQRQSIIIDKGIKLSDGLNATQIEAIIKSVPEEQLGKYTVIRVHDRAPKYGGRHSLFRPIVTENWRNGRLDIYAKGMNEATFRATLVSEGLNPKPKPTRKLVQVPASQPGMIKFRWVDDNTTVTA